MTKQGWLEIPKIILAYPQLPGTELRIWRQQQNIFDVQVPKARSLNLGVTHAPCGKRWRSKTGAICAYKLGALDGRSARLQVWILAGSLGESCSAGNKFLPKRTSTWPTGTPETTKRTVADSNTLSVELNLLKKQYKPQRDHHTLGPPRPLPKISNPPNWLVQGS